MCPQASCHHQCSWRDDCASQPLGNPPAGAEHAVCLSTDSSVRLPVCLSVCPSACPFDAYIDRPEWSFNSQLANNIHPHRCIIARSSSCQPSVHAIKASCEVPQASHIHCATTVQDDSQIRFGHNCNNMAAGTCKPYGSDY